MIKRQPESSLAPELLSAAEISQLLGCSVRVVWKLRQHGLLPKLLRLGLGLTRWRRCGLLAWIQDGAPQPVSDWEWRAPVSLGVFQKELNRLVSRVCKAEKKLSGFCKRLDEAEQYLDDRRPVPMMSH